MDDAVTIQSANFSSRKDFKALLELVNTYVKVQRIKDCSYVGFVHSVDPVSHSIILSIPYENTHQTLVIPGHAVLAVTNEIVPPNVNPPQRKEIQIDSMDDILKRKTKLVSWFKRNLLPVTESDDRIVIGNVTLLHPYNVSDISTDSPIVAMQIKNVIDKMPADFEPKIIMILS